MDNVDEFLEHFGKKGMRWGVRNKKNETPFMKRKTPTNRTYKEIITTMSLALGAGFALAVLTREGNSPMSSFNDRIRDIDFDAPINPNNFR